MTSCWQAVDWLNWDSVSFLSPNNKALTDSLRDDKIQNGTKFQNLARLVNQVFSPAQVMEKAEVLVNCGAFCQTRGRIKEARQHLNQAINIYEVQEELHRQAMAEWVLFNVVRADGDENESWLAAKKALDHVLQREQIFTRIKDVTRERWYHNTYLDMYSELVTVYRFVYDWLFKFNGSNLSAAAFIIKEKADKAAKSRDFPEACNQMELLQTITRRAADYKETGEALAFCGLVTYEMGNKTAATDLLRQALARYTPQSHECTLIRWMRALMMMEQPDTRCQAIELMDCCIADAGQLAKSSDCENLPAACSWYKTLQEAMNRAMKNMVKA